jgi:putative membrane protein
MDAIKVIHLLCVLGWMTGIFAVPRALIFWKREWADLGRFGPTGDLTIRIYRFSLGLGVIAIATGIWLMMQWGWPVWAWAKLGLVGVLGAHYAVTGWWVLRARKGVFAQSDLFLRVYNEISVIGAIGVLILVVYKPWP